MPYLGETVYTGYIGIRFYKYVNNLLQIKLIPFIKKSFKSKYMVLLCVIPIQQLFTIILIINSHFRRNCTATYINLQ